MSHPHAELMKQYAEDAAETDRPWERWQVSVCGEWSWRDCKDQPSWRPEHQYRRKPQRWEEE